MKDIQTLKASIPGSRKSVFKAILFCVAFTVLFMGFSLTKGFLPPQFERLSHGIIGTATALFTTFIFLKSDKASFADIGLQWERRTMIRFLAGMLAGVVIMGLLAAGVLYFTDVSVTFNGAGNLGYFLLMTMPLIPLALMEELGFRAYPLQVLKGTAGIRGAILITSILFALYHIPNGWTVASSFLGPAIWGLVFGLAALYSKGIAMPTGLHYAANLTTSAFGAEGNTVCLWIVKSPSKVTSKAEGMDWGTVLPALALLVFAVVCIEMYSRLKPVTENAIPKKV